MSSKFAIGDVVRLKSGGPEMTINEIEDTVSIQGLGGESIQCQWFSGTLLQDDWFWSGSLIKTEEQSIALAEKVP